jgi:hypothetical protein
VAQVYKSATRIVAKTPEVQAALAAAAERVAAKAREIAATHNDTGAYAASIHTDTGRIDHYVVSDDPSAVSKEFGRTGSTGRRGPSKGVFALTRAMTEA